MTTEKTLTAPVDAVVRLPVTPANAMGISPEHGKAAAWEVLWDWCIANGLAEHSFARRMTFDQLNGPQMVAQWILDLQSDFRIAVTKLRDFMPDEQT